MTRLLTSISVLALASAWAVDHAKAATEIGKVAAANPTIEGTPPQLDKRKLLLGETLIENERVRTSAEGSGNFLFRDQTTLTLAPNSDLTLNKYVYDPNKDSGEIRIGLVKGALRFIGGRITKKSEALIRTDIATVGIRGGIALIECPDGCSDSYRVTHIAGEYTKITGTGGDLTLSRPNASAVIRRDTAPEFTGIRDAEEISEAYESFESAGDGGSENPPDGPLVDQRMPRVSNYGSAEDGATNRQAVSTSGAEAQDSESPEEALAADPAIVAVAAVSESENFEPEEPSGLFIPIAGGISGAVITAPDGQYQTDFGDKLNPQDGAFFGPGSYDAITEFVRSSSDSANSTISGISLEEEPGDAVNFLATTASGEQYNLLLFPGLNDISGNWVGLSPVTGRAFFDEQSNFVTALVENELGEESLLVFGPSFRENTGDSFLAQPVPPGTASFSVFTLALSEANQGPVPFTTELINAAFPDYVTPDLVFIEDPHLSLIDPDPQSGFDSSHASKVGLAGLHISGEGAEQTSLMQVLTARLINNGVDEPLISTNMRGSARLGASDSPTKLSSTVGSLEGADGTTVFGDDSAAIVGLQHNFRDGPVDVGFSGAFTSGFSGSDPSDSGGFVHYAVEDLERGAEFSRSERLSGIGITLDTQLGSGNIDVELNGVYGAALGETKLPSGQLDGPYQLVSEVPSSSTISFDTDDNEARMTLALAQPSAADSDVSSIELKFGSSGNRSIMLDDNDFAMRESFDAENRIAFVDGSSTTGAEPKDDGRQNSFRGGAASSGAIGDGGIFPIGTDTDHEFLRWGWWFGEFQHEDPAEGESRRRERYHLGTFIGGQLTDVSNLPTNISAGYSGHVVTNVFQDGNQFVDGGRFVLSYDFAEKNGLASFIDVAGQNFESFVGGPSGAHHYTGTFSGLGSGVAFEGAVAGSFFTGNGDPVAATAGNIDFRSSGDNGASFRGVGTFGGDRVSSGATGP